MNSIKKSIVLVLLHFNLSFYQFYAAQESKEDIIPLEEFVEQTVQQYSYIDEIFNFLQAQKLEPESFKDYLQANLNNNNQVSEREINAQSIITYAEKIIEDHMKHSFLSTLDSVYSRNLISEKNKIIFSYIIQNQKSYMYDITHQWLSEWNQKRNNKLVDYYHKGLVKIPLFHVIASIDIYDYARDIANLLIIHQIDINTQDFLHGNTPLYYALHEKDKKLIKLLLMHGADVNIQNLSGDTALMLATDFFQCDKEILELLINQATKIDFEVKDNEGKTVLHKVIENLEKEKGRNNVHCVNKNNYHDLNMNIFDEKNISSFIKYVVEILIKNGANINGIDKNGDTPLNKTCQYRKMSQSAIAVLLVQLGADINHQNKFGQSPLHNAIYANNNEIEKLLIQSEADLNLQNEDGQTPLHIAVYANKLSTMLLDAGANLTIQDKSGKTAEQLASTPEMCNLIKLRKIQSDWNSIEKSSIAIIDVPYKN